MKSLLVLTVLLVGVAISSAGILDSTCTSTNKTHDYTYGARHYGDKLVYMDHPHSKSKWMRVVTEDVVYPLAGQRSEGVITRIEVSDQRHDNTGGCVYIANGGVGNTFVTLHVKSQRNHGYDFMVKIYAS